MSMYCVILPTAKVFFIFVSIQKPTNTFNLSSNSIYEIYIFYFSYIFYFIVNLFFIGKYILTYFLTRESFLKNTGGRAHILKIQAMGLQLY